MWQYASVVRGRSLGDNEELQGLRRRVLISDVELEGHLPFAGCIGSRKQDRWRPAIQRRDGDELGAVTCQLCFPWLEEWHRQATAGVDPFAELGDEIFDLPRVRRSRR